MARHPGTPVGDLFPPGVAIFGAGGGQDQQALPPASSQKAQKKRRQSQWEAQVLPEQCSQHEVIWFREYRGYTLSDATLLLCQLSQGAPVAVLKTSSSSGSL